MTVTDSKTRERKVAATGSDGEIEHAAMAAAEAFRDYSRRSAGERAAFLCSIADGIEQLGDALIECVMGETALPAARVANERARTCMQLRMFADVARRGEWPEERIEPADATRQPPRPRLRLVLRPLGPVAVFGASNFPLAFSVAGGDTAAALAVGCPVIVKAHPAHPRTSQLVGGAIQAAVSRCGLSPGVFSLLSDGSYEAGVALVQHPAVKAGAFTGSGQGGMALWRAAQARPDPVPFFAEMGSVNPVFLFGDAIGAGADALASGLHASMTLGVGQFCTQPGLIFVVDDQAGRDLLQKLAALVSATPPGTMLTAPMCSAYQRSAGERRAIEGVRVLAEVTAPGRQAGATLFATDVQTYISRPALTEEIFGPSSLVVLCRAEADFERCARQLPGQLTATVWTQAAMQGARADLLWQLEQKAGRLVLNGFPTGVEVNAAMMHGGPFPATTDSRFTSVGTRSLLRFVRPVAYQGEFS